MFSFRQKISHDECSKYGNLPKNPFQTFENIGPKLDNFTKIAPDLHFSVKFGKRGSHIFTSMKMSLMTFPISTKFGYSTNF